MPYRISVDVGGTFTDLAIMDEKSELRMFKAPSTPENPALGVQEVLKVTSESYRKDLKELLGETEVLIHGTTVSTNAAIERKAAKTGLLVTKGFRHVLYYRQGGKKDVFNLQMKYVDPYVPIYLTLPIEERINAQGEILVPLNEDNVRQAVRQLKKYNVEAIGVCFLWSIANPVHEKRVGEIIEEEWPGMTCSLSHVVQPVLKEFVRTSSTALDASLKPICSQYCDDLQRWLNHNGFPREFLMAVVTGGVVGVKEVIRRPVYIIFSGPTMAPVAGLLFGEERGYKNLLTIDMGGTSFDVAAVVDGTAIMTDLAMIAEFPTGIPSVEINSIGAGGGSIAWVDSAGLLHVGPGSAGALPGPACYKKGGEEPTVTDANLVLGYLNPDYFLGGTMKVDPKLSEKVIREKVANPLNLSLEEAAIGVLKVVNQNMINGILDITLKHGIDPRDFLLVVGGGAGPAHAAYLARELSLKKILVPQMAGAFCALGMLNADLRFENMGAYYTESRRFDFEGVNRILAELERRGEISLDEEGVSRGKRRFEYFMDARYPGQMYTLSVPLRGSRVREDMLPQLVNDFHSVHESRYITAERDNYIEILNWRVVATGIMPRISFPDQPFAGEDASAALKGRRKVYFEEQGGFVDTPIYEGVRLAHGNEIEGPAIIEDYSSNTVIPPEAKVITTKWGDYFMQLL